MSERRRVMFCHIPKTAGMAVYEVVDPRFAPHERLRAMDPGQLAQTYGDGDLAGLRWLRGHFDYRFFEQRVGRRADDVLAVALRDPVDRVVSQYAFFQRSPINGRFHELANRYPLAEFVELPEVRHTIANICSRYLGTQGDWDQISAYDLGTGEWSSDLASERLESCELIGLSQELDEFLLQLHHLAGWELPRLAARVNASPRDFVLDGRAVERIGAMNEADAQLYELGVELARRHKERNYRAMTRSLSDRPEAAPVDLGEQILIPPGAFGEGWYHPEGTATMQYRWSGRREVAWIPLGTCRPIKRIFMTVPAWFLRGEVRAQKRVHIVVNGERFEAFRSSQDERDGYSVDLPSAVTASTIAVAAKPAHRPGGDPRSLGVPVLDVVVG